MVIIWAWGGKGREEKGREATRHRTAQKQVNDTATTSAMTTEGVGFPCDIETRANDQTVPPKQQ